MALELFYLADGFGYFQTLSHGIGGSEKWLEFISEVYEDINRGKYLKTEHHYKIPLTEVQKYRLRKNNVPEVFLTDI